MPYIIVFRNNENVGEYTVDADKPLRIGRDAENDIMISDSAVSGVHAEIENDGGYFYITDFQSRNGTFVNRELVISRRLAHNDLIGIGNQKLKFVYKGDETQPMEAREASHEATMHIDTPDHRSRLARSVAELAERQSKTKETGMINLLQEGRNPVFLDKAVVTIGRHPDSDIVVKGWFAGKRSAEIKKKSDGYYLNPLGGRSLLVNSQRVRSEVLLTEFDIIQIGATTMQFQYHRGVTA